MKKIICWSLLSVFLQVSGLYVLNKYVFASSTEITTEIIEVNNVESTDSQIKINPNGENYKLSTSGKFLTYDLDDSLHITNIKTGEDNKYEIGSEDKILNYSWVYGNDVIQIVEKVVENGASKVQLATYNVKTANKTVVKKICDYEEGLKIGNVTGSAYTGVYYINVIRNDYVSTIYRIDRNDKLTTVDMETVVIENIKPIPSEDRLVFSDKSTGEILVTSPSTKLKFNSSLKHTVLDINENDTIFVGELENDHVISLTYGKASDDISTWKTLKFDSPICKDNLYFSTKDEVYLNDNLTGTVKNMDTNEETEYEGKFLQMDRKYIASIDNDGILVLKKLTNN